MAVRISSPSLGFLDTRFVNVTGDTMTGALQVDNNILIGGSNNELRFYEGANYVGFEAPALAADKIWVLPAADGGASEFLQTDGSGTLSWASAASAWQTTANVVNLVTGTDTVTIGDATAGGKLFVNGDADEVQLQVQAHSSQTANILEIQKSDGTVLAGVQGRGTYYCDLGSGDITHLFIGVGAGNASAGTNNTMIGYASGDNLEATAIDNAAVGATALPAITTGDRNMAFGVNALRDLTTGNDNVGIGSQAGLNLVDAINNTYVGTAAGMGNNDGDHNTAVGYKALEGVADNDNIGNTAVGYKAGESITTGDYNVFIGFGAGDSTTTNSNNVYVGKYAGQANNGRDNVFVGRNAGFSGSGVICSVIIGSSAGLSITTGDRNIFIGDSAGYRQTTLSDLLIVNNRDAGSAAAEITNSILYGVMAAAPADQTLRINASVFLPEKAAAVADVAAYGQLWVKTATPNVLHFTDDAGTDFGISPATVELTAAGPTDDLDVTGISVVFVDTTDNNVTLGGTTGGVEGQVLHVCIHDATNNTTIENEEGANQEFVLHAGADETMTAEYGGWTFVNHGGTHWHDISDAKHV